MRFETKTLKTIGISSYFSFILALKMIDAQMLFWSMFLKNVLKKVINDQKRSKLRVFFTANSFF